MTVPNTTFKIYSGALKAYEAEDKRRLKTVASSTIKDLAGDSMTENAINKMAASAKERMTIFLNHSYNVPEDVFGTVEDVAVTQRGEFFDLDFDIVLNDTNPRAVQTWDAINKGTKLGTSIGAKILDGWQDKASGGYIFDDVALLEASIVGIPANPRSWVEYAVKSLTETTVEKATVWVDVSSDGSVSSTVETDPPAEDKKKKKKDDEPAITKDEEPKDDRKAVDAGKEVAEDELGPTEDDTPANSTDTATHPEQETVSAPAVPAPQEAPSEEEKSISETGDGEGVPPPDHDLAELVGLKSALSLLTKTTGELVEAKKALGEEAAAHALTKATLTSVRREQKAMQAIIEKVSSLPIGRRAPFDDQVQAFRTRFADMYDEDFLQMLETKPND